VTVLSEKTTIRTVIVDDEPPARWRIQSLLTRDPNFEVIGECSDGNSALQMISRTRPDLVFLDVQMPGMGGFEVLDSISPAEIPCIIFVTAYDQHAIRAFDVNAVDYLLKPFDRKRFSACMERAKLRISKERDLADKERLLELLRKTSSPDRERVVVRSKGNLILLRTNDVEWIEASHNTVEIHAGPRTHTVREKISDLERLLPAGKFLRIHRSLIVNIDAVAEIQSCGSGEYVVLLRNGRELPLGRSYRACLNELLKECF
jgi:two-component system, LytTR family, response regulator